jgi:hypothetical protein
MNHIFDTCLRTFHMDQIQGIRRFLYKTDICSNKSQIRSYLQHIYNQISTFVRLFVVTEKHIKMNFAIYLGRIDKSRETFGRITTEIHNESRRDTLRYIV